MLSFQKVKLVTFELKWKNFLIFYRKTLRPNVSFPINVISLMAAKLHFWSKKLLFQQLNKLFFLTESLMATSEKNWKTSKFYLFILSNSRMFAYDHLKYLPSFFKLIQMKTFSCCSWTTPGKTNVVFLFVGSPCFSQTHLENHLKLHKGLKAGKDMKKKSLCWSFEVVNEVINRPIRPKSGTSVTKLQC